MTDLFTEASRFVDDELLESLHEAARACAAIGSFLEPLRIVCSPSAAMEARNEDHGAYRRIVISRGWLIRLTYVFHLFEQQALDVAAPRLVGLNIQSGFDSFFFDDLTNVDLNFMATRNLRALFIAANRSDDPWSELIAFESDFNSNVEIDTRPLKFVVGSRLSSTTRRRAAVASQFLLLHEMFHSQRHHPELLELATRTITKAPPADGSFGSIVNANPISYLRKALEVDADAASTCFLMRRAIGGSNSTIIKEMTEILFPIFVLLSMLDLGRRTLGGYQQSFSTHPAPDVRAFCIREILKESVRAGGENLDEHVDEAYDTALLQCTRAFQNVGMVNAAFYLSANRYLTVDDQFFPEMAVATLLQEEIGGVERYYRWIERVYLFSPKLFKSGALKMEWIYAPFGRSKDELARLSTNFIKAVAAREFEGLDGQAELVRKLAKIKQAMRPQDRMALINDENIVSPFMPGATAKLRGMNAQTRYRAVVGTAWQSIYRYANATVVMEPGTD